MDPETRLQDFEFMEVDELSITDPNLNVTSVPEQLDLGQEVLPGPSIASTAPQTYAEDPSVVLLAEMSNVVPQTMESSVSSDETILADLLNEYSASDVSVTVSAVPDLPQVHPTKNPAPPVTVTLIRTQKQSDQSFEKPIPTINLMGQFYKGDNSSSELGKGFENGKQTQAEIRLSQPADVSTDSLPQCEPSTVKPVVDTPAFDLISPAESVDTRFTFGSEDGESTIGSTSVSLDREQEIQRMAAYVREVIEKRGSKPDDMSSKLKVHEVILVILLNSSYGDKSRDLQRILTFCDENGREVTSEARHFKTLDTETMGLLWQKIKGNKKGNYDTFARAMRVRRERTEGFFEYLNAGKGKKKRIYRFGERSMEEMTRFKRTLRQVSRPQSFSY
ncbi:hypothetical protein BOX15_Mlig028334g1 [Macrostomum lignano]|uniref:ETS domain-containing protein n=2 Tax=Macrostomum lignano TaxID=282301 RepID=A0A1I8G1V5_9PLAT|nr:hypothetical protein BOX15_Mlig008409g1 [Macrostomum lignano]PAA72946.1 hypothetical protein BOX15_Mlig028334g1 [Macrostomum lignano]